MPYETGGTQTSGATESFFNVPTQNSAGNTSIIDVIGNKTDTHSGNSIYSLSHIIDEHEHKEGLAYPTLADGVTFTAGAGDWVLGAATEIVPVSTIASPFDIHYVFIEAISTKDKTYQLNLYRGDNDALITQLRTRITDNKASPDSGECQTPIIPANTQIYGKLAVQNAAGSETMIVSIRYHLY